MSSVHWTLYRVMQQVQVHETEVGELRFMCRMLFLCKVKKMYLNKKKRPSILLVNFLQTQEPMVETKTL